MGKILRANRTFKGKEILYSVSIKFRNYRVLKDGFTGLEEVHTFIRELIAHSMDTCFEITDIKIEQYMRNKN